MRTLLLVPAAALVLLGAACSSDDAGDSGAAESTTTVADVATSVGADDPSTAGGGFCDAAVAFATAQADAPDAATPEEVERTVDAMADGAQQVADTAPAEVADDAQAFAEAVDGLRQYAADRQYEVDLGAAAPEYQSGEGQTVVAAITDTIGPVDEAVQDECDHFLTEIP